jgi:hypothetical protein
MFGGDATDSDTWHVISERENEYKFQEWFEFELDVDERESKRDWKRIWLIFHRSPDL